MRANNPFAAQRFSRELVTSVVPSRVSACNRSLIQESRILPVDKTGEACGLTFVTYGMANAFRPDAAGDGANMRSKSKCRKARNPRASPLIALWPFPDRMLFLVS